MGPGLLISICWRQMAGEIWAFIPTTKLMESLLWIRLWIAAHEDRLWPDLGKSWRPDELYFFSFNPNRTPDFYVDITGLPMDIKTIAFSEMKSQITPEEAKGIEASFKLLGVAQQAKLPSDRLAEAFVYILW